MHPEDVHRRRVFHQRHPPPAKFREDWSQLFPARRQLDAMAALLHDARVFEFTQASGEQVCRDAGKSVLQLRVSKRSSREKLSNDEHRPTVTDDLQGLGKRTVLMVGSHA